MYYVVATEVAVKLVYMKNSMKFHSAEDLGGVGNGEITSINPEKSYDQYIFFISKNTYFNKLLF